MATSSPRMVTVSKSVLVGISVIAALGLMGGAFALGLAVTPAPSAPSTTTTAATTGGTPTPTTGGGTTTTPTTAGPFTAGQAVNFHTPVDTLTGQPTTLARGSKGTVVIAMASWCLYCAYEDKYVMPVMAQTPGVVVDVVDVSPQGGIGVPGPANPAFSGHDGTGGALSLSGMESTMQQYVKTFGTLSASNIHVYVAPSTTQSAWNVQSFPTMAFIGASGKVVVAPDGAQTLSQAQSDLKQALSS